MHPVPQKVSWQVKPIGRSPNATDVALLCTSTMRFVASSVAGSTSSIEPSVPKSFCGSFHRFPISATTFAIRAIPCRSIFLVGWTRFTFRCLGERAIPTRHDTQSPGRRLEVDEFHALLDAAAQVEAEAPTNRQGLGRRAMVATLGVAGFRIGEMMDLRVAQVDLQRCRFKLVDAKTDAGVREVEITLYLRDELLAYVMDRRARGLPLGPSDHFFGTATGKRRDPDRFRDRILARAAARASSNRAESGLAPLPPITPHSLRRTWATFCAMIGRDPKWVAAQIGHVNPKFTFSVYQQVATRRYIDEQAVWTLMRFADEPAERASSRQITRLQREDPRGSVPIEKGGLDLELDRLTGDDDDL